MHARRTLPQFVLMVGAAVLALAQVPAQAQPAAWPSQPLRFIVGYPPGGGADVVARLFAEHMSRGLGQRIVVENRAGASGAIGASSVAKAEPDGYTLLAAAISEITVNPAINKTLNYDPVADFAPVTLLGRFPQVLVAAPTFPPNTLQELIAYAKANPGKVRYASFGNNTLNHVNGERFRLAAGIDTVHVPYKGSGQSLIDVMAGVVEYTFDSPATTLRQVKAGKLKAIAVTSEERIPNENIPTVGEGGVAGFTYYSWIGLMAPAKTPRAVVDRLYREALAAMKAPELRQVAEGNHMQLGGNTPDEFARQIGTELAQYRQVAAKVGLGQ
jgi:tripartite-type tricarboxylate transporter receptor subunit TctC